MKKTLKRTCAVALALATTAGVSGLDKVVNTNNNVVLAETQITAPETPLTENVLLIGNYEKSVELGSTFKLPTAKFGSTEILDKCVVKSPSGTETTYTANAETKKFADITISEIGTYTVTYTYGKFSGSVTFRSTSSNSNTITLEANNKYILPSVVGKEDVVGKFYLPSYVVKDKDGKVDEDAIVDISVKDPDFKPVTVAEVTEDGEDKGAKYLNLGSAGLTPGTYTVTYTVKTAEGQFLTSTKQEFKVVDGKAFKDADKLNLSYTSEKIESVNIGKEVTLPGITAKVGTQNVPVYYSVVVKKNGTTKVTDGLVQDGDVYKFTAKEEANFYKVEYIVTSALGLKTAETSFVIDTVEDSLNPTPIVVMPYTEAPTEVKNIDYKLPSTFDDENIKLLPIFAEDLGTTNPADFKFEREIVNSNYDTVYTDKDNANKTIIFNYTGDATAEAALTDSVVAKDKDGKKINLEAGKSYYAYYKVTDKAGNSKTETYKFTVKAGFDGRDSESKPANIPTVKFNDNLLDSVDIGEVITFSEPTVTDENDARLETVVYYQYFKGATAVGDKFYPELGDDGKYTIDTKEARELEATSVKIFAEAKNDAYYIAEAVNASDKDEFIGRNEEIEIGINYLASSSAQSLVASIVEKAKVDGVEITDSTEIVEGQEITLPTIEFWDDDVETLDADVSIYCTLPAEEGKKAEVIDYSASHAMAIRNRATGMYYYSNAKFTVATAGVYTVAVKAVDSAGNTAIQFLEYTVKEAKYVGALRFANIGLTDTKVEIGEIFKLPKASLEGKGEEGRTYDWEVRCIEAASTEYTLNRNRFVANKAGEYKIQYFMYDTTEAIPTPYGDQVHEVTITVEDTTKPEIYVDWRTSIINDEDKGEGNKVAIESTYEKNTQILLPMFSADDLSGIDADKSMITIRNSANSITKTIKFNEMATEYAKGAEGKRMYFDFNDDAEYTITYTVYDKQGNSSTKEFTVKVGDLEAPELVVKSGVIGKTEYGKDLTIDLTDTEVQEYFEITDDSGATIDKTKIKVSLTVNGTTVENLETETGKYRFNLSSAGSYEMVFTVEDTAGNKTTHTETFEIAEKGDEAVNKTEVIGTVLIVLSVVVLAGVIVYFVISKRKMDKLYK